MSTSPETDLGDFSSYQPPSDGMFKGSLNGTRLPFPPKKSEFLNAGALRKLLPSHNPLSPGAKTLGEEDKQSDEILRKMLHGEGRLRELDKKATKEQNRRSRIEEEKRSTMLRNKKTNIRKKRGRADGVTDENDLFDWLELDASASQSNSSMSTMGRPVRLTVDQIAPPELLHAIGMSKDEYVTIDRAYKNVISESRPGSRTFNTRSSQKQPHNSSVSGSGIQTQLVRSTYNEQMYDGAMSGNGGAYGFGSGDYAPPYNTMQPLSLAEKVEMAVNNIHQHNQQYLKSRSQNEDQRVEDKESLKPGEKVSRQSISVALSSQGIQLDMKALDQALRYAAVQSSATNNQQSIRIDLEDDIHDNVDIALEEKEKKRPQASGAAPRTNRDMEMFGDTWGELLGEEEKEASKTIEVKPKSPTANKKQNKKNKVKITTYEISDPEVLKHRLLASACRVMVAKTLGPGHIGSTGFGTYGALSSSVSSSSLVPHHGVLIPKLQSNSNQMFSPNLSQSRNNNSSNGLRPVKIRARASARRHLAATQSNTPLSSGHADTSSIASSFSNKSATTSAHHQSAKRGKLSQGGQNTNYFSGTRNTPRILKRGNHGDIVELRQELETTEKGLEALKQAVKEDVQWVSMNVSSENMSMRAQFFCKQWGAEKIQRLFVASELNRQRIFLRRWAMACDLAYNMERLELYLRFSSTRKFLLTIGRVLERARKTAFKLWQKNYFIEKEEEKDAACCEIQRVVLGFLGKRRVSAIRHYRACVVLQSAMRVSRAVARVRIARRLKLEEKAASLIARTWNNHVMCRDARLITQGKREDKAANLLQRVARNRHEKKQAQAIVHVQRCNVNALRIQLLLRRKIARRKMYILKRQKYEKQCSLQIQLCWRRRKAWLIVQHKRKQREGCLALQCWSRCLASKFRVNKLREKRDRQQAAEALQRCARTRQANKVVKEKKRLKREKEELEASIKIQQASRQRAAKKKVHQARAERDRQIAERDLAATRIQNSQRAKKSRQVLELKKQKEAERQAELRRIAAEEDSASRQIQRAARGRRDRKYAAIKHEEREVARAKQRQLEYDSATKIQAQARRRSAVLKVNARRKYRVDEDAEGGALIEEKALVIQCAYRSAVARQEVKERLLIKHDQQAAEEKALREIARLKAMEELAELERQRLERIELENEKALVIQQAARARQARDVLSMKRFEEAERLRLEAEAEDRRVKNHAATRIQSIMRGYLGIRRVAEKRAERSFAELSGGGASKEIIEFQSKMRDDLFGHHQYKEQANNEGTDDEGEHEVVKGKAAVIAMEKRVAEIEQHHFALASVAGLRTLINGHIKVLELWSETSNVIMRKKLEMHNEHKRWRSSMLQDIQQQGVQGKPEGELRLSDLENRIIAEIAAAKDRDQAMISETILKVHEMQAEYQVWALDAERNAKITGEGADVAAERGVLLAALTNIHNKHGKQLTQAVNNAVYTIDSLSSAQAAATLAILQALEVENARYLLDVEMAARKHDGKSVKAAVLIQCMLRMRLARKLMTKKRGEESDSDDSYDRRRKNKSRKGRRPKSGKSDRRSPRSDSDDDEDEERYRKKIKKRKKRQEKREERKRLQAEYEKRRAAGDKLDSLSEMETSESGQEDGNGRALVVKKKNGFGLNDGSLEELPPKENGANSGPPILPGKISDNPVLYGDEKEAKQAENVFSRMFKRQGIDPRTYNSTSALIARRQPPLATSSSNSLISSKSRALVLKEEGGGDESEGANESEDDGGKRGGGLLGRLGNQRGGGDSSDADESSGDENAFATKVFASMGSTAKIVPLNRNMIRAEADSAMDEKLSGLLDEKLLAIDNSKKELEVLQQGIVEKMRLLDEKVEKSNALAMVTQSNLDTLALEKEKLALVQVSKTSAGGGVGEGNLEDGGASVSSLPLPEHWSEMFDEHSGATYYFNDLTGESSWTAPNRNYESDGYDTSGSKGTAVDYDTDAAWDSGYDTGGGGNDNSWSGYGDGTDTGYGGGALVPSTAGNAGDWTEQWDEEVQAAYWFNSVTLEASWTKPDGVTDGAAGGAVVGGGGGGGEWISYIDDESGKEYWYNETTGETSWDPQ